MTRYGVYISYPDGVSFPVEYHRTQSEALDAIDRLRALSKPSDGIQYHLERIERAFDYLVCVYFEDDPEPELELFCSMIEVRDFLAQIKEYDLDIIRNVCVYKLMEV